MATDDHDPRQGTGDEDASVGWPPPAHATFLTGRSDAEYWLLVDHLMHLGWSRLGSRQTPSGRRWGFRLGYTVPDRPLTEDLALPQERWIRATHEKGAMRRLLRDLQGH